MRLLVVGTATVLVGCSLCADSEVRKFVSVRGDRAMVFVRDCGATTGYSTIVQVGRFPKADEHRGREGRVHQGARGEGRASRREPVDGTRLGVISRT